MIQATELKKGYRLLLEGDPYVVLESSTQTPSARGSATLIKAKVRNIRTRQILDKSFRAAERFEQPEMERRPLQYLYDQDDAAMFLDLTSYEEVLIPRDELGDEGDYLIENLELRGLFFDGKPLALELPQSIDLQVDLLEPGAKGDTAQGTTTSMATLTNGMRLAVPMYIKSGDLVRISTVTGRFMERVQKEKGS